MSEHWLHSVPGLAPDLASHAARLFQEHNVDGEFLDFLASETGLYILSVWRSMPAHRALAGRADAAAIAAKLGGSASPSADAPSGRQRISAADRRREGHYYAHADPPERAADKGQRRPANGALLPAGPALPGAGGFPPHRSLEAMRESLAASGNDAGEGSRRGEPGMAVTGARRATPGIAIFPRPEPAAAFPRASPSLALFMQPEVPPDGPGDTCYAGTIKSFRNDTGYGFVRCRDIQKDIFLRGADLPSDDDGAEPGRALRFSLSYDSQGRPQARNVAWLGQGDTADAAALAPAVATPPARFLGQLKSMGSDYGFIDCPELYQVYRRDIYVTRAQLPKGEATVSRAVSFTIALSPLGHPQATSVAWASTAQEVPAAGGGQRW